MDIKLTRKGTNMDKRTFFEWQKSKRIKTSFAMYKPGANPSLHKWFIDTIDISSPILSVWNENGLESVIEKTIPDYENEIDCYISDCLYVRNSPDKLSELISNANRELSICSSYGVRFWSAVIDTLNFMRFDSRI